MENYNDSPKYYDQSHFRSDNRNIPKTEVDLSFNGEEDETGLKLKEFRVEKERICLE